MVGIGRFVVFAKHGHVSLPAAPRPTLGRPAATLQEAGWPAGGRQAYRLPEADVLAEAQSSRSVVTRDLSNFHSGSPRSAWRGSPRGRDSDV